MSAHRTPAASTERVSANNCRNPDANGPRPRRSGGRRRRAIRTRHHRRRKRSHTPRGGRGSRHSRIRRGCRSCAAGAEKGKRAGDRRRSKLAPSRARRPERRRWPRRCRRRCRPRRPRQQAFGCATSLGCCDQGTGGDGFRRQRQARHVIDRKVRRVHPRRRDTGEAEGSQRGDYRRACLARSRQGATIKSKAPVSAPSAATAPPRDRHSGRPQHAAGNDQQQRWPGDAHVWTPSTLLARCPRRVRSPVPGLGSSTAEGAVATAAGSSCLIFSASAGEIPAPERSPRPRRYGCAERCRSVAASDAGEAGRHLRWRRVPSADVPCDAARGGR